MDELRARNLLQAYNLVTVNGCINNLQDMQGKIYHIPNFCINDPYFEKEIKEEEDKHISKKINIKLLDVYKNKLFNIEIDDIATGLQVKQQFCKLSNLNTCVNNVRAFFGGTEINDDTSLYRYNIKSNYTIMLMVKPVDNNTESSNNGD
jgi:hypothetical protein